MNNQEDVTLTPRETYNVSRVAGRELDLLELLSVIWKGKALLLIVTLLAGVSAYAYAMFLSPLQYRSSVSLVIHESGGLSGGLPSIGTAELLAGDGLSFGSGNVTTEIAIIRSRPLLEKIIDIMNLDSDEEFNPSLNPPNPIMAKLGSGDKNFSKEEIDFEVFRSVQSAIFADQIKKTDIIELTVVSEDRHKAADIANQLVQIYRQNRIEKKLARTETDISSLAQQSVRLQERVLAAENTLKAFQKHAELFSREEYQVLVLRLKGLREDLAQISNDDDEVSTLVLELSTAIEQRDDEKLVEARKNVSDSRFSQTLGQTTPVKSNTSLFEASAATLEQLKNQSARLKAQKAVVQRGVDDLSKKLEEQSDDLSTLLQIEREVSASQAVYQGFLTRLNVTASGQGIKLDDVEVIQEAVPPYKPFAPRRAVISLMTMILTGLLATVYLVVRHLIRRNAMNSPIEQA